MLVPAVSVGNWLRKMVNHTRQRALENQISFTDSMSDVALDASASPSAGSDSRNPSAMHTPTSGLGMITTPSSQLSFAAPPPPPPAQLPNSQPFVPLSASDRSRFPDEYVNGALGVSSLPSGSGVGNLSTQHQPAPHTSEMGAGDSAAGMLQGLLGDGNDWPPWLTTSVSSCNFFAVNCTN